MNNVNEAAILKGNYKVEHVLTPMAPTDIPFPVRLDFAMTINKSPDNEIVTHYTIVNRHIYIYKHLSGKRCNFKFKIGQILIIFASTFIILIFHDNF